MFFIKKCQQIIVVLNFAVLSFEVTWYVFAFTLAFLEKNAIEAI